MAYSDAVLLLRLEGLDKILDIRNKRILWFFWAILEIEIIDEFL